MKTFAVIPIAGKGTRFGSDLPKQFIEVYGKPLFIIWAYTKSGIPTSKEFNFKLNEKGEVYRTK